MIGSEHAQRKAKTTNLKDYQYRMLMGEFLRKTGFIFINKYDRSIAVRMLPRWDEIDAWRNTCRPSRQSPHLNNPKDIWEAFLEHRKKLGDPEAKERVGGGYKRKLPTIMEQMEALEEALQAAHERAERAQREADYFADLMNMIAKRAHMSDDEIARIRAEVRARATAQPDDPSPDADDEEAE